MKNPTTYDQQVDILIERGLIIDDKSTAIRILSNLNYYTFTGYLYQFKDLDDNYLGNISFNHIYNLYLFDMKFRNLLQYILEIIESSLKTKIAYYSAHKLGTLGYLEKSNFKDKKEFNILIGKMNGLLRKNSKLNYVEHHNKKYNGDFPIWVSINIFTMGMIYNYYKNLSEPKTEDSKTIRKIIAGEYNTGQNQLTSWLECIVYIRNMVAHYMRIYNVNLQKVPAKCDKNHGANYTQTKKVFDIVHIMKFLVLDENQWNNNILINISGLFEEYREFIDINLLGFPNNWETILKK